MKWWFVSTCNQPGKGERKGSRILVQKEIVSEGIQERERERERRKKIKRGGREGRERR